MSLVHIICTESHCLLFIYFFNNKSTKFCTVYFAYPMFICFCTCYGKYYFYFIQFKLKNSNDFLLRKNNEAQAMCQRKNVCEKKGINERVPK